VELGWQLVLDVLWDQLFGEKEVEVAILRERHFGAMRWVGGERASVGCRRCYVIVDLEAEQTLERATTGHRGTARTALDCARQEGREGKGQTRSLRHRITGCLSIY